jgi:hypothetical protein
LGQNNERQCSFCRTGRHGPVRVFVGLLIIRVPVAFALGLACVPILLIEPRCRS